MRPVAVAALIVVGCCVPVWAAMVLLVVQHRRSRAEHQRQMQELATAIEDAARAKARATHPVGKKIGVVTDADLRWLHAVDDQRGER